MWGDSLFILRALQALLWVTNLAGPMLLRGVLVWFLFLHLRFQQFKPNHSSSGILTSCSCSWWTTWFGDHGAGKGKQSDHGVGRENQGYHGAGKGGQDDCKEEHTAMLLPFPQVQLWEKAPWKEAPPVASLSQCIQPKKARLLEDLNIDQENLSIKKRL